MSIKKLTKHTAIYGLSSIFGRALNWLLVMLYTRTFSQSDFGVVSEIQAYAGFLVVLYSIGMETTFFRFSKTSSENNTYKDSIFTLLLSNILVLSLFFLLLTPNISRWLQYPQYAMCVALTFGAIAFDSLVILPFAQLRLNEKPIRFVLIRLSNIAVNIALNVYFFVFLKHKHLGIEYLFISNFVASVATFLLLITEFLKFKIVFNFYHFRNVLNYALPLLVVGFAGIINEVIDRPMLKHWLPYSVDKNLEQVGIYSSNYKLAMILTMFRQAYQMGAEPLFFKKSSDSDAREYYAKAMEYFVAVCCVLYLGVSLFLNYAMLYEGKSFREGIHIVPTLLMANLFLGIYYNLSVWYKMSDKTNCGAIISIVGALSTIVLNLFLIPIFGYSGAAYATFLCYVIMVLLSYFVSKKHYPIPYRVWVIGSMIAVAYGIYVVYSQLPISNCSFVFQCCINGIILILYSIFAYYLIQFHVIRKSN